MRSRFLTRARLFTMHLLCKHSGSTAPAGSTKLALAMGYGRDEEAPGDALTARQLLWDVVVGFARRNAGNLDLDGRQITFQSPEKAMELGLLLHELHCGSVIVTLRPFVYVVAWTLPVGA